MKTLLLSVLISFVFIRCTLQDHFYNSNISANYKSGSSFTEFIFIKSQMRDFSFVTAQDNISNRIDSKSCILLVPNIYYTYSNKIEDLRIDLACPLTLSEVDLLISDLENIIKNWGKKETKTEADFYEFNSVPESDALMISIQNNSWYPSVRFNYKKTNKKSVAVLTLGPPQFLLVYEFDYKYEVVIFQKTLIEAKEEISRRKML